MKILLKVILGIVFAFGASGIFAMETASKSEESENNDTVSIEQEVKIVPPAPELDQKEKPSESKSASKKTNNPTKKRKRSESSSSDEDSNQSDKPAKKRIKVVINNVPQEKPVVQKKERTLRSRIIPNTLLATACAATAGLCVVSLDYTTGACLGASVCPEYLTGTHLLSTAYSTGLATGTYYLAKKTLSYTTNTAKIAVQKIRDLFKED